MYLFYNHDFMVKKKYLPHYQQPSQNDYERILNIGGMYVVPPQQKALVSRPLSSYWRVQVLGKNSSEEARIILEGINQCGVKRNWRVVDSRLPYRTDARLIGSTFLVFVVD